MGAELFHAGGQRDRQDEADGRFSQFWERAQNRANNEHPAFCTVKKIQH